MKFNRLINIFNKIAVRLNRNLFKHVNHIRNKLNFKRHKIIESRAYYLWEKNGRQDGKSNYYYFMAEQDIEFLLNHPSKFILDSLWHPSQGKVEVSDLSKIEQNKEKYNGNPRISFTKKIDKFIGFSKTIGSFAKNFELSIFAIILLSCLTVIIIEHEGYEPTRPFLSIAKILLLRADSIAIVTAAFAYLIDTGNRKKSAQNEAWTTVNSAQGKPGNGGRVDALTCLNEENINLSGLSAPFSDLTEINLSYSILKRVNFQESFLDSSQLEYCDLEFSNLSGAKIRSTNLSHSNFNNSKLERVDFSNSILTGCSLRNVCLENTIFYAADLRGADLRGANLRGADLRYCDLRGADLRFAILEGAKLTDALYKADLDLYKALLNLVFIFLCLTPRGYYFQVSLFISFLPIFLIVTSFVRSTWGVLLFLSTYLFLMTCIIYLPNIASHVAKNQNKKTFFPLEFPIDGMGLERYKRDEYYSWVYRKNYWLTQN